MAVQDIVQGSQTLGELDLVHYCRRHRIEPPNRQRIRRDSRGRRRYLDAEWDCSDGSVVVEDMRRERAFVRPGQRVLRCANVEIRLDSPDLLTDLIANGVPRNPRLVTTTRRCSAV